MIRFRKLPVEVEAFKWTGDIDQTDDPPWIIEAMNAGTVEIAERTTSSYMIIRTLEGVLTASLGEWIVRGVEGEIYPVKPDIFAKTYKAVTEMKLWPKLEPLPPGTTVRIGDTLWMIEHD
jgi:hypothetical protein